MTPRATAAPCRRDDRRRTRRRTAPPPRPCDGRYGPVGEPEPDRVPDREDDQDRHQHAAACRPQPPVRTAERAWHRPAAGRDALVSWTSVDGRAEAGFGRGGLRDDPRHQEVDVAPGTPTRIAPAEHVRNISTKITGWTTVNTSTRVPASRPAVAPVMVACRSPPSRTGPAGWARRPGLRPVPRPRS